MSLQAYFYDAEGRDRELPIEEISTDDLGGDILLWIDVRNPEPTDLERVATLLKVRPNSLKDNQPNQAHLENYGEYYRFSVAAAPASAIPTEGQNQQDRRRNADPVETSSPTSASRIDFLVAEGWLVTIHHGDAGFLERFRKQDKAETLIGLLTGQALAASLLDWHLGEYFREATAIEAAVDKLDERLLRESSSKALLGRMVALRRRVSKLRALLTDQRDVFYGLSRPDFALVTDSGAAPFYEGLIDRFERAVDEIERTREVVVGSFDLFTSRTSQQTNDLVKILTFLTAVVGFCAAIAGLMGMNFKLAFFDTGLTGFAMVTGGLAFVAVASVIYARRRNWI